MRPAIRLVCTWSVLLVSGSACGGPTGSAHEPFQERLDAGADCAELFELRNTADPGSAAVERMNEQLRKAGCYSSTSERTDLITGADAAERGAAKGTDESGFTVREYRIYRAVIDVPMSVSETEALTEAAREYGLTTGQVSEISARVQHILFSNGWFSTPEAEVRHATDWGESGR